jgi:cytidine deaminase
MIQEKNFVFSFLFYSSVDELCEVEQKLVQLAIAEAESAYAPYSGFQVGAAAVISDKSFVGASNMENAAYPQCLCAEQVLCSSVKAQFNDQTIEKLAVFSPDWLEHIPLRICCILHI